MCVAFQNFDFPASRFLGVTAGDVHAAAGVHGSLLAQLPSRAHHHALGPCRPSFCWRWARSFALQGVHAPAARVHAVRTPPDTPKDPQRRSLQLMLLCLHLPTTRVRCVTYS